MLIIRHQEVADLLAGREKEVLDLVADAYRRHDEGRSSLPQSVFLRFLAVERPDLDSLAVHDTDPDRARRFIEANASLLPGARVRHCATLDEALGAHDLVSFATTAATPYTGLDACPPGTVVLHISLRDLTVPALLGAHNLVDDPGHVCRENTSAHLAEQQTGGREFIDASIGALLRGTAQLRPEPGRPLVYSPFGLGVLDLALARFVRDEARRVGSGVLIEGFLPA